MASISREKNGRRIIQFIGKDGKRRSIRLGKVSQRLAEAVKIRVEDLVTAAITGHAVSDETARWIAGLDNIMVGKLADVGLIPRRGGGTTLGVFIDDYISLRRDIKQSTATVYKRTRRHLLAFFEANRPLRDILPGHIDEWRLYLISHKLADNTIRRTMGIAKQFFQAAVRKGLINRNPFDGQRYRSGVTKSGIILLPAKRLKRYWKPAPMPSGSCCLPWPGTVVCGARPRP